MASSKRKVVEFKSKKQLFDEWYQEVFDTNFKGTDIKSAMIIYETVDEKGNPLASHCRFDCDLTNMKWFHRCLGEKIKEFEFDKYLRENIDKYIEYIE